MLLVFVARLAGGWGFGGRLTTARHGVGSVLFCSLFCCVLFHSPPLHCILVYPSLVSSILLSTTRGLRQVVSGAISALTTGSPVAAAAVPETATFVTSPLSSVPLWEMGRPPIWIRGDLPAASWIPTFPTRWPS